MQKLEFLKKRIPIVEIFNSISGEGASTGMLATFIRVQGCNLRCNYCDTKYSYDGNEKVELMFPEEIKSVLSKYNCNNIICTGGEPLDSYGSKRYLPIFLASEGYNVLIETNGSVPLYNEQEQKEFFSYEREDNLIYILDVKCPGSGMFRNDLIKNNIKYMKKFDEIKFVVRDANDFFYAMDILGKYEKVFSENNILINFSPVFGEIEPRELVELLKSERAYFQKRRLMVRLNLQIHKYVWDQSMRGV